MTHAKARKWLNVIHDDVRDLYIRNDLFWQLQRVLNDNDQLANSQNIFLFWVNSLFIESITMAIRRQLDQGDDCISLRALLVRLSTNPEITAGSVELVEIKADIDGLVTSARTLRGYADRRVAHKDYRDLQDGTPTFRDVTESIGRFCTLVNKYSLAVCDGMLSPLPPARAEAWKEIFKFPWVSA
ncbi:MAG: hypothetical protein HYX25_11095 [Candidatus Solibacter usitatus]|nr:hypothetical protein [Candidatus Solibacter usitatus]